MNWVGVYVYESDMVIAVCKINDSNNRQPGAAWFF